MPDWTAPFHMPHVTTEEFNKRHDDFVAKYGYRYSIPGFDDIIHLGIEKPITPEETDLWKKRKYDEIPPERLDELKYMKEQKRQKYLDMLGSPDFHILQSRAALISSLDDTQDALSTAATLGAIAVSMAPEALGKILSVPVGAAMTAAEVLNYAMGILSPETTALKLKRNVDKLTHARSSNRKAKMSNYEKVKARGIGIPALVEGLQVTDNVFGVGICIGPIFGAIENIITGAWRAATGKKVSVKYPIPDWPHWKRRLRKLSMANYTTLSCPSDGGKVLDPCNFLNASITGQFNSEYGQGHAIDDHIDGWENVEIKPTGPSNILTKEVMDEEDPDWEESLIWPATGNKYETINTLITASHQTISNNLKKFNDDNKHDTLGFIAGENATESAFYHYASLSGEKNIKYDYDCGTKLVHRLLYSHLLPNTKLNAESIRKFNQIVNYYDSINSCLSAEEFKEKAFDFVGTGFSYQS